MAVIPPISLTGLLMIYKIFVTIDYNDYTLGSHKYYPVERVFSEMTPAMLHRVEDKEGLTIQILEVGPNLYQIIGFDNIYKMGGWKLYVDYDEKEEVHNVVFHKKLSTMFNMILLPDDRYLFKVDGKDLFLYLNKDCPRDSASYFLFAKKFKDLGKEGIFNIQAME